jgi:hypothetical protein
MSEEAEDMLKDTLKSFNFSHHGMSQFGSRAHSKKGWPLYTSSKAYHSNVSSSVPIITEITIHTFKEPRGYSGALQSIAALKLRDTKQGHTYC